MGAEDFSYMLNERPGAYLFLGIGEGPGLITPIMISMTLLHPWRIVFCASCRKSTTFTLGMKVTEMTDAVTATP